MLDITGTIRGTSREKLYQLLGPESLKDRRWLGQLFYLHKVLSTKLPTYFYELIPPIINSHRNPGCYRAWYCRADLFRNSFLPFSINEWNKLNPDIRNLDSHATFRKKLLTFRKLSEKCIYNIYDPKGSKFLKRLVLGFTYLHEHKFRHKFAEILRISFAHVLLRLKPKIIFFYDAKIMYHFAQPLWMN